MKWLVCALLLAGCNPFYGRVAPGFEYSKSCTRKAEAFRVFNVVLATAREQGVLAQWPTDIAVAACVTEQKVLNCVGSTRALAGCTYGNKVFVAGDHPSWKKTLTHEYIVALANVGALSLPSVTAATEGAWLQRADYVKLAQACARKVEQ